MTPPDPHLGPDPLVRPPVKWRDRAGLWAIVLVAAVALHGAATGAISGASWLIGLGNGDDEVEPETVKVAIVETQPEPPPPAPVEIPEPDIAPESDSVVEPKPKPIDRPEPTPTPKRRPPLDPIAPPDQPEPAPEPAAPVRRTVGLNLESTVQGGSGPAFNTGNTRMGRTDRVARDPKSVDRRRETTVPPPPPTSPNQVAQSIPGGKAKLVKPKRKQRVEPVYPALLRERGIEGVVVVRVAIDAAGTVTKVDIVAASEHSAFNASARAAALKERFRPATKNGAPISFSLSFSYRFRLNG